MRAELHAIRRDLAQFTQAEDLEAAGVSQHGAVPAHELVDSAGAADQLVSGTEIEVIGVGQNNGRALAFGSVGLHNILRDGFHGSSRADRHEDRSFYLAVGQGKGSPAPRAGFFQELKAKGHRFILRSRLV